MSILASVASLVIWPLKKGKMYKLYLRCIRPTRHTMCQCCLLLIHVLHMCVGLKRIGSRIARGGAVARIMQITQSSYNMGPRVSMAITLSNGFQT